MPYGRSKRSLLSRVAERLPTLLLAAIILLALVLMNSY